MTEFNYDSNEKQCYKLYFPRRLNKAEIGVKYPDGKVFSLAYDGLSYIGVWFHNMNFFPKACIGLEPCSYAYDTVEKAKEKGLTAKIDGNRELCFKITLSIYDKSKK